MSTTDNTTPAKLGPRQRAVIDGYRELADLLEAHPEIDAIHPSLALFFVDLAPGETVLERMSRIAREVGGTWTKKIDENGLHVSRMVGPHTLLLSTSHANVCKRVVTGPRAHLIPNLDANDTRRPVSFKHAIVEWLYSDPTVEEVTE